MGIIEIARQDLQDITTNTDSGFAVDIIIEKPTSETTTIQGLATKHSLKLDELGVAVKGKNAHISFAEEKLPTNFSIRDANKEVDLDGYKVTYEDSNGNDIKYQISEWLPDETLGIVVCILKEFE